MSAKPQRRRDSADTLVEHETILASRAKASSVSEAMALAGYIFTRPSLKDSRRVLICCRAVLEASPTGFAHTWPASTATRS
jgi:hypothetical protein